MRSNQDDFHCSGQTRRQFIKKTGFAAAAVAGAGLLPFPVSAAENKPGIAIVLDGSDSFVLDGSETFVMQPPVQWAAGQLRDALAARGIAAQIFQGLAGAPPAQECVLVAGCNSHQARQILGDAKLSLPDVPEALALARGKIGRQNILLAAGSDARGLVYALLELADRVNFSADTLAALKIEKPVGERPANSIRGISRGFNSDVEDKSWFQDREFWPPYLTMLAANRFNRFNLTLGLGYDFARELRDTYFYFAYPFLLSVPGYDVRAVPLPDAERDNNLAMLKFISDEAVRRGLHFQLGIWTHAFQWADSPDVNYTIEGLTPETQAAYCRDALRALLVACPNIGGVTIRTHGESGVPEGDTEIWKTIFDGITQCGRKVEIDLHAKGINSAIIDTALGTGMPVNISPKFWAEHMGLPYMQGAIRRQEMPPPNSPADGFFSRSTGSRSFLRYGYGDLFTEDRRYGILHRIWPGTQRLLLWGDPQMAAAYARVSSFCGSNGVEIYEPLFFKGRKGSGLPGGRDAYADDSLTPKYDFEKYDYAYRVWGRNFYNPDGDPDGWRRALTQQFGNGAGLVELALASAGKILPLVTTAHCPSAANNNYWPEMYWNMPMVNESRRHPYSDTASPKLFGNVSPLDPEFFLSCDEFADELIKGDPSGKYSPVWVTGPVPFPMAARSGEASGKYSPVWVANQLDDAAENAAENLLAAKSQVRDAGGADFRRLAADVKIQSGLGKFYAAKFRAGVLYALYGRSLHQPALEQALKAQRAARAAWAELADAAKNIYRGDVTFGPEYFQRGHWLDRLAAMDEDIADMESLSKQTAGDGKNLSKAGSKVIEQAMRAVLEKPKHGAPPSLPEFHAPPGSFQRGRLLDIVARAPKLAGVRLRYRHVNQAENWRMVEMELAGKNYHAAIPADYTDSPFPLQYHFQIRAKSGDVRLHPGLQPGWRGQPYFVVRQG
jgi:hypothetical protein